jgi:phosphoserine phosphatase RsbU/P
VAGGGSSRRDRHPWDPADRVPRRRYLADTAGRPALTSGEGPALSARTTAAPSLLARVAAAGAGSADASAVLERVATLVAQHFACACLADRLDEPDLVTRVAAHGPGGPLTLLRDEDGVAARRSSARSAGLLTQLSVAPQRMLRLSAADLVALSASPDVRVRAQAGLALALGSTDLLVFGLVARDVLLGVLTVGTSGLPFADEVVAELLEVAALTGLALDRARLLGAQSRVAEALQTSLLPPLPPVPGLVLAARYSPAVRGMEVGGDWYDAFSVSGTCLGLVIGDATGHDLYAATRMAELRDVLRAVAVDRDEGPANTLGRVDRIAAQLGADASATCLYARLGRPELPGGAWRLDWSSAGHLPPLLLRDGTAQLLETPADLMLGVDAGAARTDHTTELLPGDLLMLYTDGLVEDRHVPLDERLAQLVRVAAGAGRSHPEPLTDLLLAELAGGSDDDVAVLAVLIEGGA